MNPDILLALLLVGIIIIYIKIVRKRKKKENHVDEAPKVQSSFEKRAQEIKLEADRTRIKQVETHLIDYSVYRLKGKEFIFYAVLGGAVFFILGELFYESMLVAIILSLLGLAVPRMQKKRILEKRKDKLNLQFKEAIASLSSSLAAGRSIENSFIEVVNDLRLLYPDPNNYQSSDIFLLCSDGFYAMFPEEEIAETLGNLAKEYTDLQMMSHYLVNLANFAGTKDNVTVMCIRNAYVNEPEVNPKSFLTRLKERWS